MDEFIYHGDAYLKGATQVPGRMVVAGNLTVEGDLDFVVLETGGKIHVAGNLEGNCLKAHSSVTVTGHFNIDDQAEIGGDLNVGGNVFSYTPLKVGGRIRCGGCITSG